MSKHKRKAQPRDFFERCRKRHRSCPTFKHARCSDGTSVMHASAVSHARLRTQQSLDSRTSTSMHDDSHPVLDAHTQAATRASMRASSAGSSGQAQTSHTTTPIHVVDSLQLNSHASHSRPPGPKGKRRLVQTNSEIKKAKSAIACSPTRTKRSSVQSATHSSHALGPSHTVRAHRSDDKNSSSPTYTIIQVKRAKQKVAPPALLRPGALSFPSAPKLAGRFSSASFDSA